MNVHCSICGVNEALSCRQSHIFSQILGSHIELLNLWGIIKWGLEYSQIQFNILQFFTCCSYLLKPSKATMFKNWLTAYWNWENSWTEYLIHMLTSSLCCSLADGWKMQQPQVCGKQVFLILEWLLLYCLVYWCVSAHCVFSSPLGSIRALKTVDSNCLKQAKHKMLSDCNLFYYIVLEMHF